MSESGQRRATLGMARAAVTCIPVCTSFHDGITPLLGVQLGVDGGAEDPALRPFWRGRMGLTKEEQLELYAEVGVQQRQGLLGLGVWGRAGAHQGH